MSHLPRIRARFRRFHAGDRGLIAAPLDPALMNEIKCFV